MNIQEFNQDDFFLPLNIECPVISIVKNFLPQAKWAWIPEMTTAINFSDVVPQIREADQFISAVMSTFNAAAYIHKFPASTMYGWHTDWDSDCSLNMVLDEYEAHTFFARGKYNDGNTVSLLELKYIPYKWYVFNSQKLHTVINQGTVDRILFTVSMSNKNTKYEELVAWCKRYEQR